MSKKRRKRVVCPNCNEQLKDQMNYCFSCGQENHIKRVSIKMLFQDFFATFFTFESKFFNTLKLLFFKPSILTTNYLNGEIEKHLRPMRLYFFVSFTYFLLSGFNINSGDSIFNLNSDNQDISISKLQEKIKAEEKLKELKEIEFSFENFDEYFGNKFKQIVKDKGELKSYVRSMRSKLPIFIFLLIPIFSLLLFLGFYKKKYYYVDHFVFALHLQSFLFVILIVTTFINIIFKININFIAAIGVLIYGFIAARKFYNLKKFSTFIRLSLIGIFHMLISLIIGSIFFLTLTRFYTI